MNQVDAKPRRFRLHLSTLLLLVVISALVLQLYRQDRDSQRDRALYQAILADTEKKLVAAQAMYQQAERALLQVQMLKPAPAPSAPAAQDGQR